MLFDNIVINSVKMYFRNFIVNIFFSALMFILPYVIYLLIQSSAFSPLASFAVFAVAFFSVCLVYVPFVVSMHKARITQLWKILLRKTLILSAVFAVVSAVLYFALSNFILHNAENTAIAIVAFASILFFAWQLTVLKAVNIVCNATDENGTEISLRTVIFSYKSAFAKILFICAFIMLLLPIAASSYFTRRASFPVQDTAFTNAFETEFTAFLCILILPLICIFLYNCYNKLSSSKYTHPQEEN